MNRLNRHGAILILVLWAIGFLSVLALQMGMNIRQKMTLVQRLEERRPEDLKPEPPREGFPALKE